MKLKNSIGTIFGLLFIASAFFPLAAYHGLGGMDVSGTLWSFMLPTGWFGIIAGVGLLLHERIGLKNKRLAYAMFSFSLLLIVLFLLQDVDYFLSLWHGVKTTNFDVDVPYRWFLAYVSVYLGIVGVFVSLLLMIIHNHNSDQE